MAKISIHTATYNRAYILVKAYESLVAQTCKDFEWVITDDGSTDNTESLVKSWQERDNGFDIVYNKLSHVGVPRALNSGVGRASTEWFLMLDSDDYLMPETVSRVSGWLEEIEGDSSFAGIGFAKCFPDGRFMKAQNPLINPEIGYVDATHIERRKYNLDMDMCEVQRVSLLKKYPFQVWEGEMFAPEQLGMYAMALDGYKLRWRADKLYVCDYLADGLTRSNDIVKRNPMGYAMMHNQLILLSENMKRKIFHTVQMTALCLYSKNPQYLMKSNARCLTLLTLPLGFVLALRRYLQFRKMN